MNTAMIFIMIFISIAFIVCLCIKKVPLIREGDNAIQILSNVSIILTLIYGVFSYSHNIYPVFEKETKLVKLEKELVDSKENLQNKEAELFKLNDKIVIQKQAMQRQIEEINSKKQEQENLNNMISKLKQEKSVLDTKLNDVGSEMIFVYLTKEMMEIINRASSYNTGFSERKFKLKEETLKIANKELEETEKNSFKYKAYSYLKEFAEQKLNDTDTNPELMIEIIDLYYEKEKNIKF